jgi:hypothetical protein
MLRLTASLFESQEWRLNVTKRELKNFPSMADGNRKDGKAKVAGSIPPAHFYHLVGYSIKINTNFNNCRINSSTMTGDITTSIIPLNALTNIHTRVALIT